jgi:hypothetical protein
MIRRFPSFSTERKEPLRHLFDACVVSSGTWIDFGIRVATVPGVTLRIFKH